MEEHESKHINMYGCGSKYKTRQKAHEHKDMISSMWARNPNINTKQREERYEGNMA